MIAKIRKAMQQHDDLVVEFCYRDFKGVETRRVVSPIRFVGRNRFLGLCLCREAPRQFYLDRCRDLALKPASSFVMPVPMTTVG